MTITSEYLKWIMTYDPLTGDVVRIRKQSWRGNWYDCESVPKSITPYGYLQMNVQGRPYAVHRLIWCYMTGDFPPFDIDHLDGDRLNNKWENLRAVDRETNLRNVGIKPNNSSGVNGVSFAKDRNKWHAYIGCGSGERISLGHFETLEEASVARKLAELQLGYHPNHGRRESWQK